MSVTDETPQGNIQASDNSNAIGGDIIISGVIQDSSHIQVGHTIGYRADQVSALITQIKTTFEPKPFDGRCPYKGLEVFGEEDAELFFGREKLVEDLVARVKSSRTVFITGPSGSGKSSLVRAGLIHALKQAAGNALHSEYWQYETIKPGRDPLEAMALVFSRLKSPELADYFRNHIHDISILNACAESVLSGRTEQRFVLFIDQFEEIFTQIGNEEQRATFLSILTDAIAVENGRVILLFAMRSDFVSNCATYPRLNDLLNQQFVHIGAMQSDELVSAIAQPALRVGLRINPDLIAQIINDMNGEPGALPLMQFALKDLFDSQQDRNRVIALTLSEYVERGGIRKALERHADDSFNKLSQHEQELARSIFSGLIEIGRGTQDTKRTALFNELVPADTKAEEVQIIVHKLADARLITTDEISGKDIVTIAHEKLIDAWPWLKRLVDENRDVIALQNEISADAKEWDDQKREPSYLYQGAKLARAREKLAAKRLVLSGLSRAFLEAGIKADIDELEAAKQQATQLQKRALYLSIALAATLVAVGIAVFLGVQARQQARIAFTRQLAAQAVVLQNDKRDLAMLMSIQAYQTNDDFETQSSLLSTLQCCSDALISFLNGHKDSVWDVAFSPDGTKLASSGNDGVIIIWDVKTRQAIRWLTRASTATVYAVAFSPTDKLLAAGDGTGSITLYDTQTWIPSGAPLHGHESSVLSIKFSKDGKWLVSSGTDGKVLVWDMANRMLYKTFPGHTSWVWDVAISADDKTVASVGQPGGNKVSLRLWNLDQPETDQSIGISGLGTLVSVAFNDDVEHPLLLTGDRNGNVIIWNMEPWQKAHKKPEQINWLEVGPGATSLVWGLKFVDKWSFITGRDNGILNRNRIVPIDNFSHVKLQPETLGVTGNNFGVFRIDVSPDGKLIAAAGQDGLVSLWNATEMPSVIRHDANVTSLGLLPGDTIGMSIDSGGGMYQWDYRKQLIIKKSSLNTRQILESAISLDGTKAVTGYSNGVVIVWNTQTQKRIAYRNDHSAPIKSLTFNADGNLMASSDGNGNVILWHMTISDQLELISRFTDTRDSAIQTLLFSPDGKTLVGGGCGYPIKFPSPECGQGAIYVWNVQPKLTLKYPPLPGQAGFVWSMAFNQANPDELAVGTRDGTVTIWNLQTRKTRLSFKLGKSDVTALAFSPDGKFLAVGAETYKILVYDAHTGQLFGQSFREHDGSVITLAFAPDGKTLFSASTDSTIVIHDMNPADWMIHACRVANRNLTRTEWQQYIGNVLPYPTKQEDTTCSNLPIEPEISLTPTPITGP